MRKATERSSTRVDFVTLVTEMAAGTISHDEFRSLVENFVDISNKIDDKWHLECVIGMTYMCKRCMQVSSSLLSQSPEVSTSSKTSQEMIAEEVQNISTLTPFSKQASSKIFAPTAHSLDVEQLPDSFPTSKQNKLQLCSETDPGGDLFTEMDMEDEDDASCMSSAVEQDQPLTYEYHVVYSESYRVPVLYFNIFKSDGRLLPVEEVWKMCPPTYQKYLTENKWATLTQQEHPILGRPFLQLHPCHTGELMSKVSPMSADTSRQNYLVTWLSTFGPLVGLSIPPDYVKSI